MAQAAARPKIHALNDSWQDWIYGNVRRGCDDNGMHKVMCENDFDGDFARSAISVVRSIMSRSSPADLKLGATYACDPIRIADQPYIDVRGRRIGIDFRQTGPNVARLSNLVTAEECAQLIEHARAKLTRSVVIDNESGAESVSEVRTSRGGYFNKNENALVTEIEARLEALTGIPVSHGEPMQILHYGPENRYLPHHDYFDATSPGSARVLATGGQRIATFVIYLNDVEGGGDTVFPEQNLSVKPHRGSTVYFEYMNGRGDLDSRCLHSGAPVTAGEKWVLTKWLRERPF